jgi:hypothetical protein
LDEVRANFVERRALREDMLKEHADDVWQDARSTIQDCCNSFRKHYGEHLEDKLENGLRIRLTRTFLLQYFSPPDVKRRILVAFNKSVPCIEVTVDDDTPKQFAIDADENHAFITGPNKKEISADEFAEEALNTHLFKPPEPPRPMRFVG